MLRVALDTNVLVAALRSRRGAAHQILRQVGTGTFEHVVSVALVLEYEEVLKRPATVPLTPAAVDAVLDYFCSTGRRQPIDFLWRPALPDPSDDMVLEVAVNGECDLIVTYNTRDFRGAERFGLAVLPPPDFLRLLGGGS